MLAHARRSHCAGDQTVVEITGIDQHTGENRKNANPVMRPLPIGHLSFNTSRCQQRKGNGKCQRGASDEAECLSPSFPAGMEWAGLAIFDATLWHCHFPSSAGTLKC